MYATILNGFTLVNGALSLCPSSRRAFRFAALAVSLALALVIAPTASATWTLYTCTVPTSGGLRFILSSGTNSAGAWTKLDNAALYVQ